MTARREETHFGGRGGWQRILAMVACLAVNALTAGTPVAFTAQATLPSEHYRFQRLSVQDGLSVPRVNCIHQDRTGYMWFGTGDGLNRYDGHEILVFRPEGWDPQVAYIVSAIYEDADGFLWLSETNTDFSRFDPVTGTFLEHYRYERGVPEGLPYTTYISISGGPGGTLWIGTAWIGLLQFDPRSGEFTEFPHRKPTSRTVAKNGVYALYSEPGSGGSGVVWLGTDVSGLIRLDAETGAMHRYLDDPPGTHAVTPPKGISFIGEESPGILWVGDENSQLYRFDVKAGRFLSTHRFDNGRDIPPPGVGDIVGVVQDPEGRVWVASRNAGLAEFRADDGFINRQRNSVLNPQSLSNDLLTDIYLDRRGVVWVATKRDGVSFFDPRKTWIRHHHLKDEDGGYSNPAFPQCFYQEDADPDVVWLGSGAGLARWKRKLDRYEYYRHPPDELLAPGANAITCFSARRAGGFWIGSQGGLSRFDPETDRMIRVESPAEVSGGIDDFATGRIHAVHEDRHGDVWIGFLPATGKSPGLLRFSPESGAVRSYRHDAADPHSIGPGWVSRIHEDRNGRLWFAFRRGHKGFSGFDRGTGRFIRYQHDPNNSNSLRDDMVRALHEDMEQDVLWIGTRSGLDKIAIGADATLLDFEHVSPGSSMDDILGIEQDDSGRLWLASRSGLRLISNRDEAIVVGSVVAAETAQRFQLVNDSYVKLRSGEILIGSQTGFFEVQPDRFQPGEPPPVVLTQVQTRGVGRTSMMDRSGVAGRLVVSHEQNAVLNIRFAALDFTTPGQNRYSYQLDGLEEDWSDVSNTHTATYTTLPPGEYVFRVRASNSHGVWNEEGTSLAITVLPPWWATWWFRGGVLAALAAAIAGGVRFRIRAHRMRTRELEAEAVTRESLNRRLTASEERFQGFLTNSSEQLFCVEFAQPISLDLPEMEQVDLVFDHGYYVEANEAFASAYGATVDEVIGWPIERTLPRTMPKAVSFVKEGVRSGYRVTDLESVEIGDDGNEIHLLNNLVPTIVDSRVVRVWGTARDVTDVRRVENEMRLQQAALASSNDAFIIADANADDLPVVYVNDRFTDMTGYSVHEVLGRNCRFLQGPDTNRETVAQIRQALKEGSSFEAEILNYRKDGTVIWSFLRLAPVRDASGQLTHYVGMSTDVTAAKRSERVVQKQRDELTRIARAATMVEIGAALAHELKQPLAAVLRNAQAGQRFLAHEPPDLQEVSTILDDIVRHDRRAGNVLSRIRKHFDGEGARYEPIDLNEVVRESLSLLKSELLIRHIDVRLCLAEPPPLVLGDTIQLQQVILNLVLNAVDAMDECESDDRRVLIKTSMDGDQACCVSVSDTGPGIDEQQLEEIFERFRTTKRHGMGVGLSINRTIVESHGGRIRAENIPAGGARLVFTIPTIQSEPDDGHRDEQRDR